MKYTEEQNEAVIVDIIKAFGTYALGDIKWTAKKKPLASFILCACFIDQVSSYVYQGGGKFTDFVEKFMPQYKGMELYKDLRNGLVHNYSTKGYYRLSYNKPRKGKTIRQNLRMINLYKFIEDIESAFEDVKIELNKKGTVRDSAINWDRKHYSVFRGKQYIIPLYTNEECKALIQEYLPLLINKRVINNKKHFKISDIKKERKKGGYTLEVIATYGGFDYYYELNDAAERFKLDLPQTVLKRLC